MRHHVFALDLDLDLADLVEVGGHRDGGAVHSIVKPPGSAATAGSVAAIASATAFASPRKRGPSAPMRGMTRVSRRRTGSAVLDEDSERLARVGRVGPEVVVGPVRDPDRLDPTEPAREALGVPAVAGVVGPLVGEVLAEAEPVGRDPDPAEELVGQGEVVRDVRRSPPCPTPRPRPCSSRPPGHPPAAGGTRGGASGSPRTWRSSDAPSSRGERRGSRPRPA